MFANSSARSCSKVLIACNNKANDSPIEELLDSQACKYLAFNQQSFKEFLEELEAKLDMSEQPVLIMDNARFHHSHSVSSWLEENSLDCLFLAPYSPMLNPIEECFSKVHQLIVMARVDMASSLLSSVKGAFASVTDSDCKEWIRHTEDYRNQCLDILPILKTADPSCPRFEVSQEEDEEDVNQEEDEILHR